MKRTQKPRTLRRTWRVATVATSVVIVTALAPAATPLSAQTPQERIGATLERATEMGIPVALVESKLLEGRAKGIPTERIAPAVERRLDGLLRARDALSGIPRIGDADLDVGADALEAGVDGALLAEIAGSAGPANRPSAIAALSSLVAADVAPEDALEQVRNALDRGPGGLQNLTDFSPVSRPTGLPPGLRGPGTGPSGTDDSPPTPVQPDLGPGRTP